MLSTIFRSFVWFCAAWFALAFAFLITACSRSTLQIAAYGVVPAAGGLYAMIAAARSLRREFVRTGVFWLVLMFLALVTPMADFVLYRQTRDVLWNWNWRTPVWYEATSTLDWGGGKIEFPTGYEHHQNNGIDTRVGELHSADGQITVRYDIGELAGEHGGIGTFTESLTNGHRVRTSNSTGVESRFMAISFPDSGCANFVVESQSGPASRIVNHINAKFKPRTRIPGWFVPLLPEPIRSDCRYRCRTF